MKVFGMDRRFEMDDAGRVPNLPSPRENPTGPGGNPAAGTQLPAWLAAAAPGGSFRIFVQSIQDFSLQDL